MISIRLIAVDTHKYHVNKRTREPNALPTSMGIQRTVIAAVAAKKLSNEFQNTHRHTSSFIRDFISYTSMSFEKYLQLTLPLSSQSFEFPPAIPNSSPFL